MATLIRRLSGSLVIAAAILGVWYELERFRLNRFIGERERATMAAISLESPVLRARFAHDSLAAARERSRLFPSNADLHMLAAANLRLLGRLDEAEGEYEEALSMARRPEIFLQLGHTQLQAGRMREAYTNYAVAIRFSESYGGDIAIHLPAVRQLMEGLPTTARKR